MDNNTFSYNTIFEKGTGEFRDRGSKFFGFSFPVKNREEINTYLRQVKEEHPKASHHCFAWRLGTEGNDYRANDHGEPSGSAGKPILGQIDSSGITNVLIIVVRYFGGSLLGIPGLINAYRTAAAESLRHVQIIEKEITFPVRISFDYTLLNDVMTIIKRFDAEIVQQKMELFCDFHLAVAYKNKEAFMEQLKNIYGVELIG